jgi:hypothetical protein
MITIVYKNIRIFKILTILFTVKVLAFYSCGSDQISNKDEFLDKFNIQFNQLCQEGLNHEHKNWELLDRKFRILIKEEEPKFRDELNEDEKIDFWIKSLIYLHQRFGIQLLKRYSNTDDLILIVKKNIKANRLDVKKSIKKITSHCSVISNKYNSKTLSELESLFLEE